MATRAHWHSPSPSQRIRGSPDAPSCSSPDTSCASYLTHLQKPVASQHTSEQLRPLVSAVSRSSVITSPSGIQTPHDRRGLQARGGTGSSAPQVTAERVTCGTALGEGPSTTPCLKAHDGCVLFTFHPLVSAPTEPGSGLQAGLGSSPAHLRQVGQGQLLRETISRIFTGAFSWHDSCKPSPARRTCCSWSLPQDIIQVRNPYRILDSLRWPLWHWAPKKHHAPPTSLWDPASGSLFQRSHLPKDDSSSTLARPRMLGQPQH